MKSLALSSAVLIALCLADAEAQNDRFRIGVIHPNLPNQASYDEPFRRGLNATNVPTEVIFRPFSSPPEAVARIHELTERDRVDFIAVAGVPVELVMAEARRMQGVAFFHFSTAGIDPIAGLQELPNVVSYGPLPNAQRRYLIASVAAANQSVVVGSVLQAPALESLSTAVERSGGSSPRRLLLDPQLGIGAVAEQVRQLRPRVVGGLIGEAEADALAEALRRFDYSGALVLFSPPPVQTRAYLAARLIALGLQGGSRQSLALITAIRAMPRFSSDSQSIAIPWSIRFSNLDAAVVARLGPPAFFGPDRDGTDNTQECSCRDRGGRQVSCKNCEPNKCNKTNDGQDDCTTQCGTQ